MTKDELLAALAALDVEDQEEAHAAADRLLVAYIADPDIAAAYNAVPRWYA